MAFSDRVRWLARELEKATDEDGNRRLSRTAILRLTYVKTGCTAASDGTMV